jgi:hypothetical protein
VAIPNRTLIWVRVTSAPNLRLWRPRVMAIEYEPW